MILIMKELNFLFQKKIIEEFIIEQYYENKYPVYVTD